MICAQWYVKFLYVRLLKVNSSPLDNEVPQVWTTRSIFSKELCVKVLLVVSHRGNSLYAWNFIHVLLCWVTYKCDLANY